MKKITKKLFNPDLHEASDAIDRILKAKPKIGVRHQILLPHGRGATVTTFCTFKILQFLNWATEKRDDVLVLRKHGEHVWLSMTYFEWAIYFLRCEADYEICKFSRRITNVRTGVSVYFRGLDELPVFQQKGMASIIGAVRILFLENADDFDIGTFVDIIHANMFCGEGFKNCIALLSFNTPKNKNHWLNRRVEHYKSEMRKEGAKSRHLTYHADYRHVPEEWLGKCFFEQAKALKKQNPKLYKNEYLGLPTDE